jgi:hypothetical protein
MNVRNTLKGLIVSAVLVGIASCGGGSGYGSGGGTPMYTYTYTVGGTITGASGTVTLKLNGGGDMQITGATAQPFTFAGMIANGSTYNVQVVAANQRCTVANGAGTMGAANITNVAVSCGAQGTQKVVRSTGLSGAQENPAVVTSASGVGGVIFDPTSTGITGGVTVSGLTATSVGIFQAPSGNPTGNSTSAAIITLSSAGDGRTFFIPAGTTLTAGQITSLFAGELYFNVITAAQSAGEIRGQINLQGGVLAGVASMDFAQEVAPDMSCTGITTTGQGTVIVDRATGTILTSYMTHNVTNANMAHIHTSLGTATNGAVIIVFNVGSTLNYPPALSLMTAQNIIDFQADYLYFNIHSATDGCPSGEIRGNIAHLQ